MRLFSLVRICFLVALSFSAYAQGPIVKNYTTSDGLASNSVYDAMQDTRGFIWFATDNGVSRFDGTQFKNYTIADGLSDNTVLKIVEDAEGRLWFLTFSGKLSFYQNNKFYNATNCDYLKKINFKGNINCFFQDSKKNIWISSVDHNLIILTPGNRVKLSNMHIVIRQIWEDHQHQVRCFGQYELCLLNDTGYVRTMVPYFIGYGRPLPGEDTMILGQTLNGMGFIDMKGRFSPIKGLENYTKGNGIFITHLNKTKVWLTGLDGALEFDNGIISKENEHRYLENYEISSVLQDKNGNTWFTSERSGVFVMPSLDTHLYDAASGLADNNITALAYLPDSSLLVGTFNGSLQLLADNTIKNITGPLVHVQKDVMDIEKDKNGNAWILGEGVFCRYKDGTFTKIERLDAEWDKSLFTSGDGTKWVGLGKGIARVAKDTLKVIYLFKQINRVYAITQLNKNELLVGTDYGLLRFSDNNMTADTFASNLLARRINALAITADSTLWIGTNAYGLLSYRHNKVTQYTTNDFLLSNKCTSLLADSNKVYVATERGLNLVTEENGNVYVSYYSLGSGLLSNHINKIIKKNKNVIVLATDRGVVEFDTRTLAASYVSTPYINSLIVNDSTRSLNGNNRLKYNENSINIDFGAINFNTAGIINYRYKLAGLDTGWSYTTYTNIKYTNLRPGNYKFIVAAKNTNGKWNPATASIDFYIETPWWQTWWFRTVVGLCLVAVIYLITRWRINVYKQKMGRERAVAESELKALRAQINPHFVYNSLSAIQELVLHNQKEDANIYFSKFATLLRSILNNSRASEITLKEELDTLQLYLELEVMRYNHGFDFKFELNDGINADSVYIPSMLLQPYVENAVLHGLAPLKSGGILDISFKLTPDFIICTIEDNGIGRKKAAEDKQKSKWNVRPSLGMAITKERLDLLNTNQKQKINLEITDIADEKDTPLGTRVTIYFPVGRAE